jgi:hypothetical protein
MVDATLSPEAYREFERIFLGWLDRHQEGLEAGGLGDPRELATLCAAWAREFVRKSDPMTFVYWTSQGERREVPIIYFRVPLGEKLGAPHETQ